MSTQVHAVETPWLDVMEGAAYARVSRKLIYRAIRAGRLKAARVGGRRQVRLRREWLDAFIEAQVSTDSEAQLSR